jgi:FtsH-binding integral membrane protein
MRKEITKQKFRTIVFGTMGLGILSNVVLGYMFINSKVTDSQMRLGFYMSITTLILGAGLGLAYARNWKVQEID